MGRIEHAERNPVSLQAEWRAHQEKTIQNRARSFTGFLRNLRRARRYRLRVLDDDIEVTAPRGWGPACASCKDPCCASPQSVVSLRLLDVARLVDAGLEEAIAIDDGQNDLPATTIRVLRDKAHLDTWKYFPFLRKRKDGSCIFFEKGACKAYEHRPLQCRAFPYQVDDDATKIRWASFCQSMQRREGTSDESAELNAARDSYHEKLRDLLTRIHAPELVMEETRFPLSVRKNFARKA